VTQSVTRRLFPPRYTLYPSSRVGCGSRRRPLPRSHSQFAQGGRDDGCRNCAIKQGRPCRPSPAKISREISGRTRPNSRGRHSRLRRSVSSRVREGIERDPCAACRHRVRGSCGSGRIPTRLEVQPCRTSIAHRNVRPVSGNRGFVSGVLGLLDNRTQFRTCLIGVWNPVRAVPAPGWLSQGYRGR